MTEDDLVIVMHALLYADVKTTDFKRIVADIKRLRALYDSHSFVLNEAEEARVIAFVERHRRLHPEAKAGVTYCFTPAGMGTGVTIRCDVCRKTKNVTDYASW